MGRNTCVYSHIAVHIHTHTHTELKARPSASSPDLTASLAKLCKHTCTGLHTFHFIFAFQFSPVLNGSHPITVSRTEATGCPQQDDCHVPLTLQVNKAFSSPSRNGHHLPLLPVGKKQGVPGVGVAMCGSGRRMWRPGNGAAKGDREGTVRRQTEGMCVWLRRMWGSRGEHEWGSCLLGREEDRMAAPMPQGLGGEAEAWPSIFLGHVLQGGFWP